MIERAPAKVNLVLRVGPRREDGLHELASLFASVDLADELHIEEADRDEVICAGVEGENLAARALAAFRSAGGDPPPLRVTIHKRIPVAAGLGGGSADAAAVLRTSQLMSPIGETELQRVAAGLGSDVPSQLRPGAAVVGGAGEHVEHVDLPPLALVLVPSPQGLATASVYAELDRLRPSAPAPDSAGLSELASATAEEIAAALENDLQPPALSLRPELQETLATLRAEGALGALISGSGPTAFGVFADHPAAQAAAARIDSALLASA